MLPTVAEHHIDGLVQERRNSIAKALELRSLALTNWHDMQRCDYMVRYQDSSQQLLPGNMPHY